MRTSITGTGRRRRAVTRSGCRAVRWRGVDVGHGSSLDVSLFDMAVEASAHGNGRLVF